MIPLAKPVISEEAKRAVEKVIESGVFVNGPCTERFEKQFAKYCGTRYAIGVSSGTDALHLTLESLGIGKGDEVIVPANTFISTAFAVRYTGAKVVYADIDERYNIEPKEIKEKINEKTKAVIPVHMYGQACDMDEIKEIAQEKGIWIIEDSCQAHGAEYKGKKTGSLGDLGCFSFYPSKNMTVAGDGGMITTDETEHAERIRELGNYGQAEKNLHERIGYNSRLGEIASAIGIEQLKHLDEWNRKRREIAKEYGRRLEGMVETPIETNGHVYHLYVIRAKERDRIRECLKKKGIGTGIHYPLPVYRQPCLKEDVWCERTEKVGKGVLGMIGGRGSEEIGKVAEGIRECTKGKR